MDFEMKPTAIIFPSIILAGLFLVVLMGQTTGTATCGRNMRAQMCNPCNQVCNSEATFCPQYCLETNSFCKCTSGYYLPTANSTYCIPKWRCPPAS